MTTITDRDLEAQFTFLMEVGSTLTDTHRLVTRIRDLRRQASLDVEQAPPARAADLRRAAQALDARLYPIEEVLTQYRAKAQKDLTSNPTGIDTRLAALASFAAQADAAPTKASYDLLEELRTHVRHQAAALEQMLKENWRP